jgi:pre-60S factor REI1
MSRVVGATAASSVSPYQTPPQDTTYPENPSPRTEAPLSRDGSPEHDSSDDNSNSVDENADPDDMSPDFDPTHCLFCSTTSESVDINLTHMSKSHGMTIPSPHQLTVDPTTLLIYLSLVIDVYHECLTCGTQRRNTQAIQQHMLGKGHCSFDISDVESEYREFWDFECGDASAEVDGNDMVLPSGKTVSHRSARATSTRQKQQTTSSSMMSRINKSSSSPPNNTDRPLQEQKQQLSKQDMRAINLDKQISNLRVSDRLALAHLPSSAQRSILSSQQKQLQKARRHQRNAESRLQRQNNKTLMKHFVSDVPGPKLG